MKKTLSILLITVLIFSAVAAGLNVFALDDAETLYGDVNKDKKVNSSDALEILMITTGSTEADEETIAAADVTEDGSVNSADALLVLQKAVGEKIKITDFSLSTESATLPIDGKVQILISASKPKIAGKGEYTFTCSNEKTVKIDENGNVTAISAGSADVAVKENNSGVLKTVKIYVGAKASGVVLGVTKADYRIGTRFNLKAEVSPENTYDKSLSYISADPAVASVDSSGNVWFKRCGTTTITVKTRDGSNKTATCSVRVNPMPIPYVSQLPKYPTGCEGASACMLLKYYGFNITLDQMINTIPRQNLVYKNNNWYGPDINEKFVGDPTGSYRSSNRGYGAFSPCVTKALQKAIDERGGGYTAEKISGCTFSELKGKISNGQPAIVWATYKMQNPTQTNSWIIESTGKRFSYPKGTHVLVFSGFTADTVTLVDPYGNGVQTYKMSTFEDRWNLLGKQAIVLSKK